MTGTVIKLQKTRTRSSKLGASPSAVAKMLDVPQALFRKAIEAGEIKTLTFGGSTFIPRAEIERLKKMLEEFR